MRLWKCGFAFLLILVLAPMALAQPMTFIEAEQDGVNGTVGLDGARWVTSSPDGKHVYVASFYSDAVVIFASDPETGGLDFVDVVMDSDDPELGLALATSVVVSHDGKHVYVSSRLDHAVTAFSRSSESGRLTHLGTWTDGVGGVEGLNGAYSITLSNDDRFLYVAGWLDNAVAVFERDRRSGALVEVQTVRDGIDGVDGLEGPTTISLSPNGHSASVTAIDDGSLAVFHRSSSDGRLTFLEVHRNVPGGPDCLTYARSSSVSPDGGSVFVSGRDDSALCLFRRDRSDGLLTFQHSYHDDWFEAIAGTTAVVMTQNGRFVFATGRWDDAVAVFSRDPVTGRLGTIQIHRNGVDGVIGMGGPVHVAVNRNADAVYVASYGSDSIAVFKTGVFGDGFETVNAILWDEQAWQQDGTDDPCSLCSDPSP